MFNIASSILRLRIRGDVIWWFFAKQMESMIIVYDVGSCFFASYSHVYLCSGVCWGVNWHQLRERWRKQNMICKLHRSRQWNFENWQRTLCLSMAQVCETWAERVHWTGQMKETVKPRTVVVRQLYICNHLYILIRFVAIFSKHFLMAKHTLWSSRDAQHLGSTFWPKQCPQILWLKICTTLDSIIFMSLDVFICVRCFSICWLLMLFQE